MLKKIGLGILCLGLSLNSQAETVHSVARDQQKSVDLTLYSNFALVREVRTIDLPKGTVSLEYQDVPSSIDASSVLTRSLSKNSKLVVLEQSYQYQLLNKQNLLKHYIGKPVTYIERVVQAGGAVKKTHRLGNLLSINPEIVNFDGQIEIAPAGVVALSQLPENLALKPTLVWRLANQRKGRQDIETSYLVNNLGWAADYVMVLDEEAGNFDLNSWVTVNNQSGGAYKDVAIQLIAGEVNRVQAQRGFREKTQVMYAMADSAVAQPVFDYHHYSLPNRTSLKHNETRQIRFFDASAIKYNKQYQLTSTVQTHRVPQREERQADVLISFNNKASNNLGQPLPAGKVKVYAKQSNGKLLLLGEDAIDHTADSELVELKVGQAFDIKVVRTQTAFRQLSDRLIRVEYEVEVRNQKTDAVDVKLREQFFGDWTILKQSMKGLKLDSATQVYDLKLPAKGAAKFSYAAEIRF